MKEDAWKRLEQTIGYSFVKRDYLELAMTHSSFANEFSRNRAPIQCNERLEFLGDAVLELVTSEFIYNHHQDMSEGSLSKLRASMVCEPSLAICARDIGLGSCIRLGRGEEMTGGQERDSILSDAFESLIGAVYLDGGLEPAKRFVNRFVLDNLQQNQLFQDAKTVLQELTQKYFRCEPVYSLVAENGPAHCKTFTMSCRVNGEWEEIAEGSSKKHAEQKSAMQMIERLKAEVKGAADSAK